MISDRISELPDAVIHKIHSFLDMKKVLQTSLLSKRWQHLWVSLPYLNFDKLEWGNLITRRFRHKEFMRFVEQVLLRRDHNSTIQKLFLSCRIDFYGVNIDKAVISFRDINDAVCIDKWVSSQSIEQLHLEFVHLLSNSSFVGVKTLQLILCFFLMARLHVDDSHRSTDDFVLNLPNAEKIVLQDCNHGSCETLVIDGPEVRHLVLENLAQICKPECEIRICAPNIKSIEFLGYMYQDYHLENMLSVVDVKIETNFYSIDIMGEKLFFKCLYKMLGAVAAAQSLTLTARDFQAFRRLPKGLKRKPATFSNVTYLKLTEWHKDGHIGLLANLLKCFPNLETLVLERSWGTFDPVNNGGNWGAELSFQCKLDKLKTIHIQNLEGCNNELIFIGFLLKNAEVLEKVILEPSEILLEDEQDMMDIYEDVQLLPRASSSVTVSVKPDLTIAFEEFINLQECSSAAGSNTRSAAAVALSLARSWIAGLSLLLLFPQIGSCFISFRENMRESVSSCFTLVVFAHVWD